MHNTTNMKWADRVNKLPPEWGDDQLIPKIYAINQARRRKICVLDDDPTGVQTVNDVPVLTKWDLRLLGEVFEQPEHLFFILTNTRALEPLEVERINREIIDHVLQTAKEKSYEVHFISRSDSTLRGYYPLEMDIIAAESSKFSGSEVDGHLIIPAFFEAGRYTFDNVHYLKEENEFIPVHCTEFAKDKVFGFSHSNLIDWVLEKTEHRYEREEIVSLSVEQIREGPDAVEAMLNQVTGNLPVIINALTYRDLEVVAIALIQAEEKGKRFIYRTAASFVKAYGGMVNRDYLRKEEMIAPGNQVAGGLVIIGSHTKKTTRQLEELLNGLPIAALEMDVENVLNMDKRNLEINQLITEVNQLIQKGRNAVVYSSRRLISRDASSENLKISQLVSDAFVRIVDGLEQPPQFIIAKGGITSSDIATKGLKINKATVLGQAAPAVPVWQTGEDCKFPYMPYIIFPGNVGNEKTLLEVVKKLIL